MAPEVADESGRPIAPLRASAKKQGLKREDTTQMAEKYEVSADRLTCIGMGVWTSDGFHPNDSGYAYIASEVLRAATSASYPVPQGGCGAMTIVPNP